jgi:hypothetical protein
VILVDVSSERIARASQRVPLKLWWNPLPILGTLVPWFLARFMAEVGNARPLSAPLSPLEFWDVTYPV